MDLMYVRMHIYVRMQSHTLHTHIDIDMYMHMQIPHIHSKFTAVSAANWEAAAEGLRSDDGREAAAESSSTAAA